MVENTRYKLMQEEAIKAPGVHTSIRQLPLWKAYPSKYDIEAKLDFLLRLKEYRIEVGIILNEELKWDWRSKRIHIMYLGHAFCRKDNNATSYGKKFILKWKTWEIKFEERKKYKYNFKFCSRCNSLFLEHHEKLSGLF